MVEICVTIASSSDIIILADPEYPLLVSTHSDLWLIYTNPVISSTVVKRPWHIFGLTRNSVLLYCQTTPWAVW